MDKKKHDPCPAKIRASDGKMYQCSAQKGHGGFLHDAREGGRKVVSWA